jgi:hypothetical protein
MRLTVALWKTTPESRDTFMQLGETGYSRMKDVKGCLVVKYCSDYENNMFCQISLWETQKDIDDYHELRDKTNPNARENLTKLTTEPPILHIYDVIEPK